SRDGGWERWDGHEWKPFQLPATRYVSNGGLDQLKDSIAAPPLSGQLTSTPQAGSSYSSTQLAMNITPLNVEQCLACRRAEQRIAEPDEYRRTVFRRGSGWLAAS